MNTRKAANEHDESAPDPDTTPRVPSNIQDAVNGAIANARAQGMKVDPNTFSFERSDPGQMTIAHVHEFLRKKFPAFVLFVRAGDEEYKNEDGTWKEGMDPAGPNPPKREWRFFFDGPETLHDPKMRTVVSKWLDANAVRDFTKDRLKS